MSALGANRTRRDSGNDVNDPQGDIRFPLLIVRSALALAAALSGFRDDPWGRIASEVS